ncbi:FAD-dependent oxidoreductase [Rhizobiaceae bacterium n13]|uniref:FAD-dependent oxidoreductase n=1 Tax=Ferirhizobium litorale TaxID=2927786 RepID=A0AAE3U6I8_9HYPH|nr:FAD-dependent oxidoreductase [Fererhizobium litorale]MDI7865109.1 FAD-dependent oxidoreductase [Fererhizobium litorale]MDI7925109.1 FAD-dependent oxidoreductase [Fererhizobium litorale]
MNEQPGRLMDCIVVGGGPAGLTTAIYLARYHLSTAVFDNQPCCAISHNHAGSLMG